MAKILVIRGGAIGDFILTLPVFSALKSQFPEAELEVLGYSHIAALAVHGGLARAVRSIEARPLAGFFARDCELDPELKQYFAEFALIISFLYDPDQIFRANVGRCSRAQFIAGPHRPDENSPLHATEVYLKALERLAIFNPDPVPRLATLGARTRHGAQAVPVVALHPGSGSPDKNWPEAKWAELIHTLGAWPALRLLLVGGEAEENRLERLAFHFPAERVQVARSLALPELAARLAACTAFVGHDSGISHLAAALGLPVLALWGATPETIWCPRGQDIRLLKEPRGLSHLPVETVLLELKGMLPTWA